MKSLIIGGAGFVGGYLIQHLSTELNHEVVVTKLPHEKIEKPFLNQDTCATDVECLRVYDLDILQKDEIVKLLQKEKPDYIFHLAAQSSVALSWKNPELTVDVNIKGSLNLLDAVRELGFSPRVLLIGSAEEYGRIKAEELPIPEDNPLRPGNIYAVTKACQNMIGKIYADAYDMDVVMVRAFNHTGPNQSPVFVVADFCKQVADIEKGLQEPVIRVGNLSAKRDFTDVRDVVRAYSLLMEKGEKEQIYNVGSGHAIAIESILQTILSNAKCEIEVIVDSEKMRPIDMPVVEADTRKIYAHTGWRPEIELEKTIQDTLEYYRKM
ncbi:MAG: GDP-mannose 4,6-dehydratase [Agathobacter sp.]|nr:GDP-mannose 4,6-dehydratase [Agathobacter sp.]